MTQAVQVTVKSKSGLGQDIIAGPHHWKSDEPSPIGKDSGPSPYEMLLASLGACTSMTLRLYAERKGIELHQITVRLRHFRIHAEDCADCETKIGFLDRIECEIDLSGNLDETQRQRLLEIANRCPVHRTLQSEISIKTRLASSQQATT